MTLYDDQIYASGVHSILLVDWKLRCETPLAIRNGIKVSYSESSREKTRGEALRLRWERAQDESHEVAALHFGYEIQQNTVNTYHFVPPSSVRGALRSWTIRHLVHPDFRSALTPPPKESTAETEAYGRDVRRALHERSNGFELIASLFGLAADTRSDMKLPSNSGRMRIETTRFERTNIRSVDASGVVMLAENSPNNVKRQMTVRNPLDRMTHASRDGGLHHFLEFCGETFRVQISILNPQASDIGLLALWAREISTGILRLGGLTSIGRGRMSIVAETYDLWGRPNSPLVNGSDRFQLAQDSQSDEPLAGIWTHYVLAAESLSIFEQSLLEHVSDGDHA